MEDFVKEKRRIGGVGGEPVAYKGGGFGAAMAAEQGYSPVFWEENVAGTLDFTDFIKAGDNVADSFVLP